MVQRLLLWVASLAVISACMQRGSDRKKMQNPDFHEPGSGRLYVCTDKDECTEDQRRDIALAFCQGHQYDEVRTFSIETKANSDKREFKVKVCTLNRTTSGVPRCDWKEKALTTPEIQLFDGIVCVRNVDNKGRSYPFPSM